MIVPAPISVAFGKGMTIETTPLVAAAMDRDFVDANALSGVLASRPKCEFLNDFTFANLFTPVAEEVFRARHWERMPLVVHRADRQYYGDLFTLLDFDDAIARASSYWTIDEAKRQRNIKREGTAARGLENVLADMRGGATLLLDHLEEREAKLGLLCRLLGQQLGYKFQTNLYLTPPQGQGFRPHWDNHDVFILQVVGSKHWNVEKQRRRLPGKDETMREEEGRVVAADAYSFTLDQGDMVYIPRGFVHAAKCGSEPSLHITLGVHTYTWEDLLQAIIKVAVHEDERLRRALPFGFMHDGKDRLVKGAMAVLSKIGEQHYLNAVVDRFKDELVTKAPLDISGQVTSFLQPTQLTAEDIVGARPGIVYRIHISDENVRLNFGSRAIAFPRFFEEPLDFALKTKAYAIRDIVGDLEDQEKIVFIERLMQEGLIVRK